MLHRPDFSLCTRTLSSTCVEPVPAVPWRLVRSHHPETPTPKSAAVLRSERRLDLEDSDLICGLICWRICSLIHCQQKVEALGVGPSFLGRRGPWGINALEDIFCYQPLSASSVPSGKKLCPPHSPWHNTLFTSALKQWCQVTMDRTLWNREPNKPFLC